jgi:hypothetical protein
MARKEGKKGTENEKSKEKNSRKTEDLQNKEHI